MSWAKVVFLVGVVAAAAAFVADGDVAFVEDVRAPSRIVSGWESSIGQHPHQVSLRMTNSTGSVTACGGSIIHSEWVLTAAHCTAQRVSIIIRAGVVNLTRPEAIFESTTWFNHPLYLDAIQSIVQPHDISLLKLERTLEFSANLQPIRLQRSLDKNNNYAGELLIASGWGRTWTNQASPENMNWVYLQGTSNEECRSVFGSIIVDSAICAGPYNVTSQSTCQGDSGGPLTITEADGVRTLVGVTSFVSSSGCHTPLPAGFIRPGHYHDWFEQVTGINFDWQELVPLPTTTAEPETPIVVEPEEETERPDVVEPENPEDEDEVEKPDVVEPEQPEEDSNDEDSDDDSDDNSDDGSDDNSDDDNEESEDEDDVVKVVQYLI